MNYSTIIVGGGVAGLTSAAFLSKAGISTLLCEKEAQLGGLVGSFSFKGFTLDAGIRAMENSGILLPMLKQLGLDIDFLENTVSIGIEDEVIDIKNANSLEAYKDMLCTMFPDDTYAINKILDTVKQVMIYMDILYGIDNPLFLDFKEDREYLLKTILPWMFKYITTVGKIKRFNVPVEDYLKTLTNNQVLIDIIAQHFFTKTPAFFALSYFSLYLDYQYPKGGTGTLISALENKILENKGNIKTQTTITEVNTYNKSVKDMDGNVYFYDKLIWAADIKTLYQILVLDKTMKPSALKKITQHKELIADKTGGDSVLTLYLTADLDKKYFEEISGAHFFYTPQKRGLSIIPIDNIQNTDGSYIKDKDKVFDWVKEFWRLTTFEISIPVMRDEALAPKGKTALIISSLMEYALVKHIEDMGWYDEFKEKCQTGIIEILIETVYPKLEDNIIEGFVSTPLTLQKRTGNSDGAITGWSFTNKEMPAVSSMPKIAQSIKTPISDIVQAGQWTYSPSGFPISILTGKLAADYVQKKLKR